MEQHAIPQQISSYEFKLVGEMTLKQFLKAGAGIVLALLINSSGLIFFVKYPLVFIFGGGGLALAFVPFEDRPLETWILSFIKSIYNPTIFVYKKRADKNWLNIDLTRAKFIEEEKEEEEKVIPVKNRSKVAEFIDSLPSVKRADDSEDSKPLTVNREPLIVKTEPVSALRQAQGSDVAKEKAEDWRDIKSNLGLKTEKLEATAEATFGSIPMPDIPDVPNLVVGMVTSSEGKIVDGAIVEILDDLGNPVRVLKTNPLGQFRTSTQLSSGRYLVVTEKDGFDFDRVEINLLGKIVEPIKIQALA